MELLGILSVLTLFAVAAGNDGKSIGTPRLVGGVEYMTRVVQELVLEIENFGWWNLIFLDVTQTLNEHMYNWHVSGTVNYTSGFVVSIEKIDLTDFDDNVYTRNVNGTTNWIGRVIGDVNLRNVKVGFDVIVDLDDQPEQRLTGVYMYTLITVRCSLEKNINTNEHTAMAYFLKQSSPRSGRVIFLPQTHLTQVLSRRFQPSSIDKSIIFWSEEIITPILVELVKKIEFPKACFSC